MVPFFLKYPAKIGKGQIYDKPVSSLDIFSTIAAVTNSGLPDDRAYDGVNLMNYLDDQMKYPHEIFFWRSGYSKAICKREWKLYLNEKSKKTFLFNLSNDIGEHQDLSAQYPEKVKELKADLDQWEQSQARDPSWPSAADVLIDVGDEEFYFPT